MSPPVASFAVDQNAITGMITPVSKRTYFNTKWVPKQVPLCPYDMLYHPPDYNPKAARSDRQEPKIIRKNIWDQELQKIVPSTTHFILGRPTIKIIDIPTKQFVRTQVKNENPHTRIYNVLEWAVLINEGKTLCDI